MGPAGGRCDGLRLLRCATCVWLAPMVTRTIPLIALFSFGLVACAEGQGPPNPQPTGYPVETYGTGGSGGPVDTDGDTEGPMPEFGHLWCTRADNSVYEDGNGVEVDIVYADDGSAPQGCSCAPQETHDWLIMNMTGSVVPMDGSVLLPSDVVNLRGNIYQEAENECFSLVPDPSFANNCNDGENEDSPLDADPSSVGFQYPPIAYGDRDGVQECEIARSYEVYPTPGECSFIDGNYSFTDAHGVLMVSSGFVDKILGMPGCLYLEDARIELNGSGSYEFVSVTRGELLYELGVRSGDVPLKLNGYDVTTAAGAFDAWAALQGTTKFTLVVQRGGSSVKLTYELV